MGFSAIQYVGDSPIDPEWMSEEEKEQIQKAADKLNEELEKKNEKQ